MRKYLYNLLTIAGSETGKLKVCRQYSVPETSEKPDINSDC